MNGLAGDIGPIGKSPSMDETFHRAHRLALAQGHGVVTLEHMLFALTEDADAIGVLATSGVIIDKLRADVSGYLGRLGETVAPPGAGGAQPGPDLLRIVQLAASAARQSPRKQIDGAIILAAIIGEAKSAAAGMLKAHGLTFEEVIRVLQRAQPAQIGVQARPAVPPPAPPVAPPVSQPRATPQPPPQLRPAAAPVGPPPVAQVPSQPPKRESADVPPAVNIPAAPRPAPAAAPSTEEMLASVRARVKQAEPAPLNVRAPAPASKPATAAAASPAPAAPKPDAVTAPDTAVAPEVPAAPPAEPVATHPVAPMAEAPAMPEVRAMAPAEPLASAPPPANRKVDDAARSSAFEALANAPTSPKKASPPPVPAAKPAPPPLPPAGPVPRGPGAPSTALPPPPRIQPAPAQPASVAPSVPQGALSPPPPRGPAAPAAPVVSPVAAPMQPPVMLRPPIPVDIIAAARGIPGEVPVGESVVVEIRIPREQLDVIRSGGASTAGRVEPPITRAVSVQLISEIPGALGITPLSAETVWYDRPALMAGEEGIWRFALTPALGGKHGVTLSVLGRTIGPYGLQIDPSAVSETFEVTVHRSFGARLLRLGGYVAAFVLGALIANLAGAKIAATVAGWLKLVR